MDAQGALHTELLGQHGDSAGPGRLGGAAHRPVTSALSRNGEDDRRQLRIGPGTADGVVPLPLAGPRPGYGKQVTAEGGTSRYGTGVASVIPGSSAQYTSLRT